MKKLILMLLLIWGALGASALESPFSLSPYELLTASATATPALFPDADAVVVEDITVTEYQPDGSSRSIIDMAFKILTEKGRQQNAVVSIGYDAAYGKTEFTLAQIIKPDGTAVPIDLELQSRETIDAGQMQSNIYDPNNKTIRLSVPDLQIGDVLRYAIQREENKARVPGT